MIPSYCSQAPLCVSTDPRPKAASSNGKPALRTHHFHAWLRMASVLAALLGGVLLCNTAQAAWAQGLQTQSPDTPVLRVISTPNPNVFPLLLAMAEDPDLPVRLVPVATGTDIVNAFHAHAGDALLSMTYTAAQAVVTGAVPQLELVQVDFWRGFWMLAPRAANIRQFSQLQGQGVLIAGPTAGGKGGGPDLIFQAAIARAHRTPSDFNVCYLPVMKAAPMMVQQRPMSSNPACAQGTMAAPTAISLVEPAATGLVMESRMSDTGTWLQKSIDIQRLFTGYTAWPQDQLPHGGVSVLAAVLHDPSRQATTDAVLEAYRAAADEIMAARGHPLVMIRMARTISAGIAAHYGQYGLSLPPAALIAALASGDLAFRTDLSIAAIQPDLGRFLTEVVGKAPPASFYHAQ